MLKDQTCPEETQVIERREDTTQTTQTYFLGPGVSTIRRIVYSKRAYVYDGKETSEERLTFLFNDSIEGRIERNNRGLVASSSGRQKYTFMEELPLGERLRIMDKETRDCILDSLSPEARGLLEAYLSTICLKEEPAYS